MKVIAITQARIGSTRLPGKVLKVVAGKPLLQVHLERIAKCKLVNKIIVATTKENGSEKIEEIALGLGHLVYKGSVDDVLDRFYHAAQTESPDLIVRVTSDCPLIDPSVIDKVIEHCISHNLDYCSNTLQPTFPDGMDTEVFSFESLQQAWKEATDPSDREHVTPYIRRNSSYPGGTLFSSANVSADKDYSTFRLTVDNQEDLEVIDHLVKAIGDDQPWTKYVEYLCDHTDIRKINSHLKRNEGSRK